MFKRSTRSVYRILSASIRRRRGNRFVGVGARICQLYLRAYWNERHYDMAANGEIYVLQILRRYYASQSNLVVFDVGANRGDYTAAALDQLSSTQVHCFELMPALYTALSSRWSRNPDIVSNDFGLSDSNSEIKANYYPESPTEGRIDALGKRVRAEIVQVNVRRGDDYMKQHHIDSIDLLKIDTEGHELSVLKGFSVALAEARITAIQFEYGTTWLAARALLSDAYALLEPHGYVVGRLYPDGVDFKHYFYIEDEHFKMGNYIAVHNSQRELVASLQTPNPPSIRGIR